MGKWPMYELLLRQFLLTQKLWFLPYLSLTHSSGNPASAKENENGNHSNGFSRQLRTHSSDQLVFFTIVSDQLVFLTISSDQLVFLTISSDQLVFFTIASDQLVFFTISSDQLVFFTISSDQLVFLTISSNQLVFFLYNGFRSTHIC
jgi:hypothetical protein